MSYAFTKKVALWKLTEEILAGFASASISASGDSEAVGDKQIGLVSDNMDETGKVCTIYIDDASPTNTQLETYVTNHDYNAALTEAADRVKDPAYSSPKLDLAVFYTIMDYLRDGGVTTDTNAQACAKVKTKYGTLS